MSSYGSTTSSCDSWVSGSWSQESISFSDLMTTSTAISSGSDYDMWKLVMKRVTFWLITRYGSRLAPQQIRTLSHQPYLDFSLVQSHAHLSWDRKALAQSHHPSSSPSISFRSLAFAPSSSSDKKQHRSTSRKAKKKEPSVSLKKRKSCSDLVSTFRVCSRQYQHRLIRMNFCDWEECLIQREWTNPRRSMVRFLDFPLPLVLAFPQYQWDTGFLFEHLPWGISDLQKYMVNGRIPYKTLSRNLFLRPQTVTAFPDEPWHWKSLATHPAFPPQMIWQHYPELHDQWHWRQAIRHPRLTFTFWRSVLYPLLDSERRPTIPSYHIFISLSSNQFKTDRRLRRWACFVIHRFLFYALKRHRLRCKARFLQQLSCRLPSMVIVDVVLPFLVSNTTSPALQVYSPLVL